MAIIHDFFESTRIALGNARLAGQLLRFNLLVGTLPLLIIGMIIAFRLDILVRREVQVSRDQIALSRSVAITAKIQLYQALLGGLGANQAIHDILSLPAESVDENPFDRGRRLSREVMVQLGDEGLTELMGAVVYSLDSRMIAVSPRFSTLDIARNETWYPALRQDGWQKQVFPMRLSNSKEILCMIQPITRVSIDGSGNRLGFVKLDLDLGSLCRVNARDLPEQVEIVLISDEGQVCYNGAGLERFCPAVWNQGLDKGRLAESLGKTIAKGYLFSVSPVDELGWQVVVLFNARTISRQTFDFGWLVFGLVAASALILCVMVVFLTRTLALRFGSIIAKMELVEKGDFRINHAVRGNDEIARLDMHFNRMVATLDGLFKSNYAFKIASQQAGLKALQFQINPHFLYNTLEVINAIARIRDCPEICDITQRLGAMFRYNGGGAEDTVELAQEFRQIENYMEIQKIRFSGRYAMECVCSVDPAKVKVLKFILQPVVENALKHGLEPKGGSGIVSIRAEETGGSLVITVSDDGVGMDPQDLAGLLGELDRADSGLHFDGTPKIGLHNVHARLRLRFGPAAGVRVESQAGHGTKVVLTAPLLPWTDRADPGAVGALNP